MGKNPLRLQYHFSDLMKFIGIFSLVLALFAWQGVGLGPEGFWYEQFIIPTASALVVALTLMKRRRPALPRCAVCGQAYFARGSAEPAGMCPRCRVARLPRADRRRQAITGFILLIGLSLMLATGLVLPVWEMAAGTAAGNEWLVVPVLIATVALLLFALIVVAAVVGQVFKTYRMSLPGKALDLARVCAGDEGEPEQLGLAVVWGFGAKAPVPLLSRELELCTERFELLAGAPVDHLRPLDVFVFGKRDAYELFLTRALFVRGVDHDGMFVPWPRLTVALTTDPPLWRLADFDRMVRTLFAYRALASYKTFPLPWWLQVGFVNVVACDSNGDERDRLNRKVLAAIASGRALDHRALLEPSTRTTASLLRNLDNRGHFVRYVEYVTQAWSFVDFLCGADAPAESQARFRTFLAELRVRQSASGALARHYELSCEQLVSDWKAWVEARGHGRFTPLPRRAGDRLRDGVIPLLGHSGESVERRVRAVREIGRAGAVEGATALIGLLTAEEPALRAEARWALECISGRVLGDHPATWDAWLRNEPVAPASCAHAVAAESATVWAQSII